MSGGEREEQMWGRRAKDGTLMGTDKPKGSSGHSGQILGASLLQLLLSVLAKGIHGFFIHLTYTLGPYCVPGIFSLVNLLIF